MARSAISLGDLSIRRGLVIGPAPTPVPDFGRGVSESVSESTRTEAARPVPTPVPHPHPHLEVQPAGHPVPTADSERAGRRALAIAGSLATGERLLVLLSGGASALMVVPADGVALADKQATTARLLREGADIHALNTVRKHLSGIKGGWLAAAARGRCDALVVSDVVGDDLSVVASGPTVPDTSRFADALDVIRRFGGEAAFPGAVARRLARGAAGDIPDTPKPGDPRLEGSTTTLIGSRRDAMEGAATAAAARGYHVVRIDEAIVGEARDIAASHICSVLARAHHVARPACFVSSGETTVHVTGRGSGGRNQEFALAAAIALASGLGAAGSDPCDRSTPAAGAGPAAVVVSIGTDGVDGPTDAAGACADQTTLDRARAAGLAPEQFLSNNDAYAFFRALGDLIHTGPTGTNVGDLQIILLA
jgi:glycerate 2-kinase